VVGVVLTADRAAFLKERQSGIGATDAAGVLGLSPWATPLSVYQSKVEPIAEEEVSGQTLPQWLGLRLEDVVAELFFARTGLRVRADNQHHRHPAYPWLVCHLDYRVVGSPDVLVECKTANDSRGWGDEMTEDVPVHYWVQAQHEMLVTSAKVCYLAVLFGFREFRTYLIHRDEAFLSTWRQAAAEFWQRVERRDPPPLEGDEVSRRVVRSRWPEHDETLKTLPPERELVVLRLRDERAKLKAQEAVVATLEHRVEDLIGDAAGITGSWGKVTWKQTKDRVKVAWQLVAEVYRAALGDVVEHVAPGDNDEAVRSLASAQMALDAAESMYTSTEPGYRRIDVRFKQ